MRPIPCLLATVALALLSACASPDSRISKNQSQFDQYPTDVQQKIRTGQIDVGFTAEMVTMALGEPARKFMRKTAQGDTEVWSYLKSSPKFSLGLGVGSSGRSSGVGGGVGVSTGGASPDESVRIEIRGGLVTAVDYLNQKK